MGLMADSEELLRALTALGAIRMPTAREQDQAQRAAGGAALWRLQCAHHLAGAVECQVLMAAAAVPAVKVVGAASGHAGIVKASCVEGAGGARF